MVIKGNCGAVKNMLHFCKVKDTLYFGVKYGPARALEQNAVWSHLQTRSTCFLSHTCELLPLTQTCSQFHFLLKQREGACNG